MDREKMDEILDRLFPYGWCTSWPERADMYRMMEEAYAAGLAKGAAGAAGLSMVLTKQGEEALNKVRHHTCVKCLRLFQTRVATQQYCERCRGLSI